MLTIKIYASSDSLEQIGSGAGVKAGAEDLRAVVTQAVVNNFSTDDKPVKESHVEALVFVPTLGPPYILVEIFAAYTEERIDKLQSICDWTTSEILAEFPRQGVKVAATLHRDHAST